ncbi:MAG: hypothetical protein E7554_10250 [Ruminococcaceae bacterium]|nr:hypothetical protein [Oscillospiraceae bacterium]
MAKEVTIKIKCAECEHENEVTIYAGLNAQVDTEKYVELLNGTLFNFDCAGCGKKGHLNYDMIYHDIVHRAVVHYVTNPDSLKKAKEAIETMKNLEGENAMPKDYTYRIVNSQNALREKALLFNYGLDDRVMEILKGLSVSGAKKEHPDLQIVEALYLTAHGKWMIQILGNKPMSAEVSMVKYDEIRRKLGDAIEDTEIRNYAVDVDWSIRALQNPLAKFDNPQG